MPEWTALPVLAVLLVSSLGWGGAVLALLRWSPIRDARFLLVAVAMGLGVQGHLVLGVGLAGLLTPSALGVVVAAGCVGALWQVWSFAQSRRGVSAARSAERSAPQLLLGVLVAVLMGLSLISVFRPVDGLDWDGLSYHLAAPKIYLREQRIRHIPYDSHTNFPFTMEMLYTVGLAFSGPAAAKSVHWAAGWLTAAAVGIWLRTWLPNSPRWAAPAAAAAFASTPLVLWEMGTAYVDLGTALFQFLALAVLLDGLQQGDSRTRRPAVWVAAALTGFALGTKYTALLQFGFLGLGLTTIALRAPSSERSVRLAETLGFGTLAACVALPWYLKNWMWVQNPVHPFLFSLFPNSFSWTREAAAAYETEQKSFGMAPGSPLWSVDGVQAAFRAWWDLGMHPRHFYSNQRTLIGDKLGSLGPLWIGFLPLLFWNRHWTAQIRGALIYVGASFGVWLLLSHQSRYFLPVLAPLTVVIMAHLLFQLRQEAPRWQRVATAAFLGAGLLLNLRMHTDLASDSWRSVNGEIPRSTWLTATLGGLFPAAEFINQLPANSTVALYQETRGFYFDRPYFWANPLQHNLIAYDQLTSGSALMGELRRFGITHVLINFDFTRNTESATWYRLLMDAIRTGAMAEVFRSPEAVFERRGVMVYALQQARPS